MLEADGNGEGASITQRLLHDRLRVCVCARAPVCVCVCVARVRVCICWKCDHHAYVLYIDDCVNSLNRVERRQQGGAPGWITVLTVLLVCAILGLILGQVRPPPR